MTEFTGLRRLIREMHRRSLWQVMAVYLAASWAVFEAVQGIVDAVNLPEWLPALALVLLLIGFPVVLATAIVQEGMPSESAPPSAAAARDSDPIPATLPPSPTTAARLFTWRNAILGGMAAFALWGLVAAAYLVGAGGLPTATAGSGTTPGALNPDQLRAIAVLPFDNLSAEQENAFFADGIHEDVLTQLSKIGDLTVISRTSVMPYRETDKGLSAIAAELGVGSILEGSVRRSGDNVRITAQLIDASTDQHLWADNFDRALSAANVFAIQTEIAREIAAALEATLSPAEESRIARNPTESLTAYDFVLQGRAAYRRYTDGANTEAIRLYREALELDPSFSGAWAGLADAFSQRTFRYGYEMTWVDSAAAAANLAIEANPESARGYKALALMEGTAGRWGRSTELNLRAVELDPNFSDAINNVGSGMWVMGRLDEALGWFERSFRIDPNNAFSRTNVGSTHADLGLFAEAEAWLEEALKLDPTDESALTNYVDLELMRGRIQAAAERADRAVDIHPDNPRVLLVSAHANVFAGRHELAADQAHESVELSPTQGFALRHSGQVLLGYALLRLGRREEAGRTLDDGLARARSNVEAGDEFTRNHWDIATIHAIRGEADAALEWAERAFEAGYRGAYLVDHNPMWDGMREDPRFQDLLRRMHEDVEAQRARVEEGTEAAPQAGY